MPPAPSPRPARTSAPTRTARPLIAGARPPVRIDLTDGGPFGGWPGEAGRGPEPMPMSDLSDRTSSQVLILRKAIEEAAMADRTVRVHSNDLAERLAQGQRMAAELDDRLGRAGRAAIVVEKAASALVALQGAVEQVRTAQDAVTRTFEARLAEQEHVLTERLAQQEAAFEQRMCRQQEVFERRFGELSAKFDEAMDKAVRESDVAREQTELALDEHRRSVLSEAEQACAAADRHVAQAQARCSLIVDGVADRVEVLTQQCDRIGKDAQANLDAMCERAARILGHDPRSDYASEPRLGSLADAAAKAGALVLGVDEAAARIGALRSDAERVLGRLVEVSEAAERTIQERTPGLEALRASLDQAGIQATMMQQTLDDALNRQAEAADKSASATLLLVRQREDLATIAEAGRYHVEQCQGAAESLREMVELAGARASELDRAAADVREQAESMVALARDATALVARARASAASSSDAQS